MGFCFVFWVFSENSVSWQWRCPERKACSGRDSTVRWRPSFLSERKTSIKSLEVVSRNRSECFQRVHQIRHVKKVFTPRRGLPTEVSTSNLKAAYVKELFKRTSGKSKAFLLPESTPEPVWQPSGLILTLCREVQLYTTLYYTCLKESSPLQGKSMSLIIRRYARNVSTLFFSQAGKTSACILQVELH